MALRQNESVAETQRERITAKDAKISQRRRKAFSLVLELQKHSPTQNGENQKTSLFGEAVLYKVTMNSEPSPSLLFTFMLPPNDSICALVMKSPTPLLSCPGWNT